jgi:rhamnose transport system ATP-binding protein
VLYVSHRLEEVSQLADRVTVLRDGQLVWTRSIAQAPIPELIRAMVGRELGDWMAARASPSERPAWTPGEADGTRNVPATSADGTRDLRLEVIEVTRRGVLDRVSFDVRAGEIVGLAGLVGAGRSEIARAIFGIDPYDSGTIKIAGRPLPPASVPAAMAAGVALLPEDRQHEGLVLPMSAGANLSLAMLRKLGRGGFINRQREMSLIERQMSDLNIRADSPRTPAHTLSGGNQQKLVLGKWLSCRPAVLILDEPTRGIDVAAKAQVHRLIRQLAEQGLATLIISSELPELLAICHRVLVVRQGQIVGERQCESTTQEELLRLALPDAAEVSVP